MDRQSSSDAPRGRRTEPHGNDSLRDKLLALGVAEGEMREGDALIMFGFKRIATDETASSGSDSREPKGANEEETP